MRERIAVTGLGAFTPLGMDLDSSWRACLAGEGAIKTQKMEPGEFGPEAFAMPVALPAGDPTPDLEAKLGRRIGASLDPFSLYALAAANEAILDAKLPREALARGSVIFGHGIGGVHTLEAGFERYFGKRSPRMHPLTVPKVMASAPVSAIAIEYGMRGPSFAVASACASAGHAMAQGALLLRAGLADLVIVGGSEAIASPGGLVGWDGLRAMSPSTCRPFSAGRDGMVIGEGAGALVLETERHAGQRGARPRAYLDGVGMSSDAVHWTQPDLDGAVASMRAACEQAGVIEESALLISAHGTGTPLNDKNEAQAIHVVFGAHAMSHPVIATKSAHGHLIGASSAVQAALGLRALEAGKAPPILNYLGPDPECALNLVLEPRDIACRALLVNAFAFGGLNASLVFRLPDAA